MDRHADGSGAVDPNAAVDFIVSRARKFAKAKAERVYLEEFRKSKKALLMAQSDAPAANAREQYAYSHPDYLALLEGLRDAIEEEEALRWQLIAAQARVEVWRSQEASNRNLDRAARRTTSSTRPSAGTWRASSNSTVRCAMRRGRARPTTLSRGASTPAWRCARTATAGRCWACMGSGACGRSSA